MKRFLIMFMVLGLITASAVTAEAKGKKRAARIERTVQGSYGPYPAPATGCNEPLGSWACVSVPTQTRENFFTAKVTDTHGQPVFVEVLHDGGRDTFCGETTSPIATVPGSTLRFYIALEMWPGHVDALKCPANRVKTTGTISVTLSNEGAQPVRSGSILTGTGSFVDAQLGGCQVSPDCSVWLQSGCEGALAGWRRGLTASIVDVDELADGPPVERVFRFGSGDPWGPVWGGVQLQFWTSDCVEVPGTRWLSTDCDGRGGNCQSTRLRIPRAAKWMTVTGYQDNVNLAWTLT